MDKSSWSPFDICPIKLKSVQLINLVNDQLNHQHVDFENKSFLHVFF